MFISVSCIQKSRGPSVLRTWYQINSMFNSSFCRKTCGPSAYFKRFILEFGKCRPKSRATHLVIQTKPQFVIFEGTSTSNSSNSIYGLLSLLYM